jgi:hypothetical protein
MVGYQVESSRDDVASSLDSQDRTRLPYAYAVNDVANKRIICGLSTTTGYNDYVWVLDYRVGFAWTRWEFANPMNSMAVFENINGTFQVYAGDYAGTAYKMFTGYTDNGQVINSYAEGGDMYSKSPVLSSGWVWVEVRGQTGGVTQYIDIEFFIDGSNTPDFVIKDIAMYKAGAIWGQFNWGQANWFASGLVNTNKAINLEGKTLRWKIKNKAGSNFAIEGFSIYLKDYGWRQD